MVGSNRRKNIRARTGARTHTEKRRGGRGEAAENAVDGKKGTVKERSNGTEKPEEEETMLYMAVLPART